MNDLFTSAGEALDGTPWSAYPRPQLRRKEWLNLNGPWHFSSGDASGNITVPFCPESLLSGVHCSVVGKPLIYQRTFSVPSAWAGSRILLHFGAVSRITEVQVNGHTVAEHSNSYLPFTVDITQVVLPDENVLTVHVTNDLSHRYPWGKQKLDRGGMWYTPVSGIWQTVWLEPVPESYIAGVHITANCEKAEITIDGVSEYRVLFEGRTYVPVNGSVTLIPDHPVLWTPDTPQLYPFSVTSGADVVESYFALRTISVETIHNIRRICLNGKPTFLNGLLDQGYWSDGLYTAPTPASYEQDILAMKSLGFNMLRKHIKIEPEQFYYDCDRLGMLVLQDMVNCGDYHFWRDTAAATVGFQRLNDHSMNPDPETRANFLSAMKETVAHLRNHPSIIGWTIFNEGWGQFCADDAYTSLRALDSGRLIDSTSGWFRQELSDLESLHIYFGPLHLGRQDKAQFLSEFGGFACKIPEHSTNPDKTYGYRKYSSHEDFLKALRTLYLQLPALIKNGLCGCVYTQVSDVEDETNGFLTYDRKVLKIQPEEFSDLTGLLQNALQE